MSGNSIVFNRVITANDRSKEIDLRKELDDFLFGSLVEISKHYEVLIRQFRRDKVNQRVKCKCNVNNEGSINPNCPLCLGEGYLWDEKIQPSFKGYGTTDGSKFSNLINLGPGDTRKGEVVFYFRWNADIKKTDIIIELQKDKERTINFKSLKRGKKWKIQEIEEKRSDYGRLEYLIVYCTSEDLFNNDRVEP